MNSRTLAQSVYLLGKQVTIDDHKVVYVVTGVMWRGEFPQFELSWLNDVEPKSAWVEGWRVSAIEQPYS
jgi:hypothetical protein